MIETYFYGAVANSKFIKTTDKRSLKQLGTKKNTLITPKIYEDALYFYRESVRTTFCLQSSYELLSVKEDSMLTFIVLKMFWMLSDLPLFFIYNAWGREQIYLGVLEVLTMRVGLFWVCMKKFFDEGADAEVTINLLWPYCYKVLIFFLFTGTTDLPIM